MQRPSPLAFVAALAFATLASAAPVPHEAWASGHLARVDASAKSVVVTQGKHEMTFVLGSKVQLTSGHQSIDTAALARDIGRPVRIRYTLSNGTKVADQIQVSPGRATVAPPAQTAKPK